MKKKDWPTRYARVSACLAAIKRADAQFPEAACPIASRLLIEVLPNCTLMCGYYKDNRMDRNMGPIRHFWVFDMRARVHIDITQAQFPGGKRGIVVYGPNDPMESL